MGTDDSPIQTPFAKLYFSEEMVAKYEPLACAIDLMNETNGDDEEVWRTYQVHLKHFNNFDWFASRNDGKKYDLVFYGVSGYTGYLMMEYIKRVSMKVYPDTFTFAFAGRTPSKVEALRDRLFAGTPWEDTPILQMSYDDVFSVIDLVRSAKVIINVAGPYMLTAGEVMVDACIHMGVNYVDISGEVPWSLRVLELHKNALAAGVYVIPSAASAGGFPDLCTFQLANEMKNKYGEELRKVICYTTGGGSAQGASGGTLKTRAAMSAAGDESRSQQADPFSMGGFIPDRDRWGVKYCNIEFGTGKCTPKLRSEDLDANMARFSKDEHLGVWRGPHVYSYFDTRIVRRSNSLLADLGNRPYGRNLNFLEYAMMPDPEQMQGAGANKAATSVDEEKKALEAAGKYYKEGEGPPLEDLADAWTGYNCWAQSENGNEMRAMWIGRDGYFETARVAIETALALVQNRDELPYKGGCLTPTVACGEVLARRMLDTGIKFRMGNWFSAEECFTPPYPAQR